MNQKLRYSYYNLRNRLGHSIANPRFFSHYFAKLVQYNSLADCDAYLISYPKSGRTWLQRLIVEAYLHKADNFSEVKDIFDLHNYINTFPKILPTHGGACWEESFTVQDQNDIEAMDYQAYLAKPIVFMVRDPRDVLVSQYYHMKYRTGIKNISKHELIHSEVIGLPKMIAYMNKWMTLSKESTNNIKIFSYEELHRDTINTVQAVLVQWNLSIEKTHLQAGIQRANIAQMRAKESPAAKSPWQYTKDVNNQENYHARKGEIGEHTSFFTMEELVEIKDHIALNLDPEFTYVSS